MSRNEIVTIVDDQNNVVGSAPRFRMRAEGLPHRATYILVFNTAGDLYVQKRTMTKDIYPGYYDVATGGVVLAGESYLVSAQRELAEELGIQGVALKRHFDFYHTDTNNRVWGLVYSCTYDGKIVLQEEEVESGDYYSLETILRLIEQEPFTPDGMNVLKRFMTECEK
jgi:isopentenyldiphosphate isomerase